MHGARRQQHLAAGRQLRAAALAALDKVHAARALAVNVDLGRARARHHLQSDEVKQREVLQEPLCAMMAGIAHSTLLPHEHVP